MLAAVPNTFEARRKCLTRQAWMQNTRRSKLVLRYSYNFCWQKLVATAAYKRKLEQAGQVRSWTNLQKLLKELDSLPADYVPSVDELVDGLPYVNAVFKETLRLYPIGILSARKLQEDCNVLGYNLQKGTSLHICTYNIHRDPDVWDRPDEFVPERWIDGEPEAEGRPQNAWFPFGDGNVGCIGMRFAQQEAKITLIRLFQRFTFKIDPAFVPLKLDAPLLLGPKDGYLAHPIRRRCHCEE
eukprot:jgi/Botrbrau1/3348/Bobra.0048s0042.1